MRPTASPRTFPFAGHRTMAEVMRDESSGCNCELTEIYGDADDCGIILAMLAEGEL